MANIKERPNDLIPAINPEIASDQPNPVSEQVSWITKTLNVVKAICLYPLNVIRTWISTAKETLGRFTTKYRKKEIISESITKAFAPKQLSEAETLQIKRNMDRLISKELSDINGYPTLGKVRTSMEEDSTPERPIVRYNQQLADMHCDNQEVKDLFRRLNYIMLRFLEGNSIKLARTYIQNPAMELFLETIYKKILDQMSSESDIEPFLIETLKDVTNDWEQQLECTDPYKFRALNDAMAIKILYIMPRLQTMSKDAQYAPTQEERIIILKWLDNLHGPHMSLRDIDDIPDMEPKSAKFTNMLVTTITPMLKYGLVHWSGLLLDHIAKKYNVDIAGMSHDDHPIFADVVLSMIKSLNIFSEKTTEKSFRSALNNMQKDLAVMLSEENINILKRNSLEDALEERMTVLKPILDKYLSPKK